MNQDQKLNMFGNNSNNNNNTNNNRSSDNDKTVNPFVSKNVCILIYQIFPNSNTTNNNANIANNTNNTNNSNNNNANTNTNTNMFNRTNNIFNNNNNNTKITYLKQSPNNLLTISLITYLNNKKCLNNP